MAENKIIAIIQARMGSERLPGKVLMELGNKPVLQVAVNRIEPASKIDLIVVATSDKAADDPIEDFCLKTNIDCIRGDEDDVCRRFFKVVESFPAEHYLRFCADSPMQDPRIIDQVIKKHLDDCADYTTNGVGSSRTFPLGMDVRIAKRQLFIDSFQKRNSSLISMENPLAYVHNNYKKYKLSLYKAKGKLKRPELRFILDYKEDLEILRNIFSALSRKSEMFSCEQAIDYIDQNREIKEKMRQLMYKYENRKVKTLGKTDIYT